MKKIAFVFLFFWQGFFAQQIQDIFPEYLRQVNKGKKEWQRIKVIDYDNRYGWARLNKAGTGETDDYILLRTIKGEKYLVFVECNCSPVCAPADFVFFKLGNYREPVADPIDWGKAMDAAREIMQGEKDYELFYFPDLYSDRIYVVAKISETSSLEVMLDEEASTEVSESELFKKCVYNKKNFEQPKGTGAEYIGYYIVDEKLQEYKFIRRK